MERLVVLCDEKGTPTGTCEIFEAHENKGKRHLAISVVLYDPESDDDILLQTRSPLKPVFANRIANSVCTHPLPDEDILDAGHRRLYEELRVKVKKLIVLKSFCYQADDPLTGKSENEFDTVLLGEISRGTLIDPDPNEIAECHWDRLSHVLEEIHDEKYAPWLGQALGIVQKHLNARK